MKRNLSFFLIILSVVICITACSGGGSNGDGNGDVTPPADSSAVFDTDNPPIVIYAEGIPTDVQATIYQALKSVYGTPPEYTYDPSESDGKHEIIIGKTNLSISREAYRRLRAYTSSDNYESTFVIYAEGSSVAIAYDEDSVGFACAEGVRYFAENYVIGKTELTLNEGVVASKTVSVLDHYAALDAKNRETAFNTLAAHIGGDLGAELVSAMKELYAIYNPDVITWFANLYDPGVGGFYFSNSARDKHGFLPDLESTGQALFFIEGSGMLSGTGSSSFASILSDETKAQIAKFIRSCQDPNGYFYHPQWSKAETDAHPPFWMPMTPSVPLRISKIPSRRSFPER